MQGLFYTNGSTPNDPPGCQTIVTYLFVGRRFTRSVVQIAWDSNAQFASAQRSEQCGRTQVQWGDFIVNPILPASITLRFFENTAMGFSAQSGVLSSACPDALDVKWTGRAEPERWVRASQSLDRTKPSPAGIWEGKLNVFGSVCDITMSMKWLIGESNLFYWNAHVHKCDINFGVIPVAIGEDETEEDADSSGRRQSRWISPPTVEQLEHREGRRLLASASDAAGSAGPTAAQQTGSEQGGVPISSGVMRYDVEGLRRSADAATFGFTSYPLSQRDYDTAEQLPRSNCTQIGKLCPGGSACALRSITPEGLQLVQQYPATAETNASFEMSFVDCVCAAGFTVEYSSDGVGTCVDVNECALPNVRCPANSYCVNSAGSFSCPCAIGYNQTSRDAPCLNVDECSAEIDNCHLFASCTDSAGSFTCACKTGFAGTGLQCETQNVVRFEQERQIGQKIGFTVLWDIKAEPDVRDVVAVFKDWERQITWMYTSQAECPTQSECLGATCILDCHRVGTLNEPQYTHVFIVPSAGPGLYTVKYYSHKLDAIIAVAPLIINGSNPDFRSWALPPDARESVSGGLNDCEHPFVGASCIVSVPLGGGRIVAPADVSGGTPAPIAFTPRCGDGRMTEGNETCDDGNTVGGDGCSATCQIEPDSLCVILFNPDIVYDESLELWRVIGQPDSSCIVFFCSDGDRNARGETCDDGNTRGGDGCSAECTVEPGYDCEREDRLDGSGQIVGTNERCVPFILWLEPDQKEGCPTCHPLGDCVLWRGEKYCYCYDGYARNFTSNGQVDNPLMTVGMIEAVPHLCRDVDECAGVGLDVCATNAICTNTLGSFRCGCGTGFTGSGYGTGGFCVDNNECDSPVCAPNAICTNTLGSYSCTCPAGQSGGARAQDGLCRDINECETGAHDCGTSQICVNYGGENFPGLSMFACTCPTGRIKFATECFPPGFAEENLDFFERMGQDGVPVHAQGMMRFWDLEFIQPWGRFSFAEWHYVDTLISPTAHKAVSFVPSTGYEREPVECPACSRDGLFVQSLEGVLSAKQGVWLSDVTCKWIFNKQGTQGVEQVFFHFREFHLEADLEYIETCKIGQRCIRYDESNQVPVARVEAPFELFFHSRAVDINTPGRQNAPDPANPWKYFIVYSPKEQFNEIDFDWRALKNADQPGTVVGNFTVPERDHAFERDSKLHLGITNGDGLDRTTPCGFQHDTAAPYSVMTLDKLKQANFTAKPGRPRHRTELEGVWEGTCYPHVPRQTATCQVDLRIEESIFELSYFGCTGFAVESLATGLITQIDEEAVDIVSLSDVHLLSYKRFQVQYTSGIPTDTDSDLTTANGIFLWRSDAAYAIDTIEVNLHRPGQMRNPNDFPGDNDDLEIATKSCQILYLKKIQLSNYAIPPPLATTGTVFYAAVKQQNLYLACNASVTAMMEYLEETNCADELQGILGTRKDYDTGNFMAECRSGCLGPYKQRLSTTLQQCVGAWGSLQREGPAPGVSEQVFHYLGGRVLFLVASQQRSDSVCVGSYRNLTCNALPLLLPSVIAGSCPLNGISTVAPEIGVFPYTRFSLVNSLQTGCVGSCLDRMESFMLLGHCCLVIMDEAQRRWWQAMAPYSTSYDLDLAAYRCMYANGPCDQSTSDVVSLQAPLQACGFTQSESWSCAYGACGLGLPARCCQPFPCANGAWREAHGSCYCRCVNAWTGSDCGSRSIHVEGAIRFTETNMIAFDEQTFLSTLANAMQVARSNAEMGYTNVIEGQRRVGRMTDTVEIGFRILVESERDALRTAATLQVIREQGTFAVVFGQSGFGQFSDFIGAPVPRSPSGDPLCDDEVFMCPDSMGLGRGDDGAVFIPPDDPPNPTGAIAGGVVGGLVFCACCVAYGITHKHKLIAKFEGREEEEDDQKKKKKTKEHKLTAKERRNKDIQDRKKRETDMGMVFGFGNSTRDHEHAKAINKHKGVVFSNFAKGQDAKGNAIGHTNSYNTKNVGQTAAFKEALLLGTAARASDAAHHLQPELEPFEGERGELDAKLSLKQIAAHQRMLAARLATINGQQDKQWKELEGEVGWRRSALDPSSLEAQDGPSVVPPAYTYPDILLPEDSLPHEQYEETREHMAEAKQRQDNVLALFERANSSSHETPTGTPQRSVREISFLPAMTNFPTAVRPPGYLSASLVHPHDRHEKGNGAANTADSLLSNSMAPPPIPMGKFEVPVTPDKAWNSLGLEAGRTTSAASIDRTLSMATRSTSHFQSDEAIAELYRATSTQSAAASSSKNSKAKFDKAKLGILHEGNGNGSSPR